jgi:hypothetical protein
MKKISFVLIFIAFISLLSGCKKEIQQTKKEVQQTVEVVTGAKAIKQKQKSDKDLILIQANTLFRQAQIDGVDLRNGPCLSNDLAPDWVLDIAHNPRIAIDDQPENQCSAFAEGRAHHFVELDEDGKVINVY